MNKTDINNWEQFEEKTREVYQRTRKLKDDRTTYVSPLLFRGQHDEKWKLESTLDRIKAKTHVKEYYKIIRSVKSPIESFTSNYWPLPNLDIEIKEFYENENHRPSMEYYQFMTHLRHQGFPTPLLDWTRSPYIAAFFAFNEAKKQDVAIFMYNEYVGHCKIWDSTEARLLTMGPNVTTHKRHHLQQSEYTFCIKKDKKEQLYYTSHEEVFEMEDKHQDLLEKYVIPFSQKSIFLSKLNQMNINAHFLFETEEGLMNKLSNEKFIIDEFC